MIEIETLNIVGLLKEGKEGDVDNYIQTFECQKNKEVEDFLKTSAVDFCKRRLSITYIVLGQSEKSKHMLGYFTLAYKIIQIPILAIASNTVKKKIEQFVIRDISTDEIYTLPAILIAQFAKNDNQIGEYRDALNGDELMSRALGQIQSIQATIGGRFVFLECEDKPALMRFYNKAGFEKYNERVAEGTPGVKYNQLLKII